MASAHDSDSDTSSGQDSSSDEDYRSGSDLNDSDSDDQSGSDNDFPSHMREVEPCKYYNKGHCREGQRCPNLHFCKYALKGNCRKGSRCKLKHPGGRRSSSDRSNRALDRSTSTAGPRLTDGRPYQWQLNAGSGWIDIDNDHIIEAQYSLPHTKSIKIYNTEYGAICIDYNKMRVFGKKLRMRRLDDGKTEWNWYCTLRHKWIKYGDKDSKGRQTPAKSSDIEKRFQSNPTGSFNFSNGAKTFEIRFRDMQQVRGQKKRKVTRRPLFRQKAGASQSATVLTPQWQFEGNHGTWYEFKRRRGTSTECSITSADIETKYQQNNRGSMTFQVKGQSYKLDFGAMTQTNLSNNNSRRVRRVMV